MRRMGRGRVDGRADNDHVDIDIATFTDDQGAVFEQVFEQLSGWNLIAHDAIVDQETTEPWDGRRLVLPAHVHAHSDADVELEVLINERTHDEWVLNAEPAIVLPISTATALSPWRDSDCRSGDPPVLQGHHLLR